MSPTGKIKNKKKSQANRRLSPWQSLLLLIFSMAACFGLVKSVLWALNTPHFNIKVLSVEGLNYESENTVINKVSSLKGTNIFKANLKEYEARLVELDHVENARLYRDLPARIRIEIVERKLLALLNTGTKLTLVDDKGIVAGTMKKGQIYDLPIITAAAQNENEMLAVINFLRALKSLMPEAYKDVSEVAFEGGAVKALIGESLTPILLSDSNHREMAQKLWIIMNKSETSLNQMEYADLRYPGKVFFKRKHH